MINQTSSLQKRFFYILVAVILLLTVSIGFVVYMTINNVVQNTIAENNKMTAEHIAAQLDVEKYETLATTSDEQLYTELQQQLTALLNANKTTYLYVVAPSTDGALNRVLVDAGDLTSEDTYAFGDEAEGVDFAAINKHLVEEGPYSEFVEAEGWGNFLSNYVPLKDSSGNTFAIVGVDEEVSFIQTIQSASLTTTLPLIIGIIIVMSLLSISAIYLYVAKSLKPVEKMRIAANELEAGAIEQALQTARSIDTSNNDDISTFAKDFTSAIEHVHTMIADLTTMAQGMNDATNSLNSTSTQVDEAQRQLKTSVQGINGSMEQQQRLAEESFQAMEALDEGVTSITQSVEEVVESLQQASSLIEKNADDANAVSTKVTKVASSVVETANNVNVLSARYTSIEDMITVIQNIAEQTNLLALNAAIEAARAGEAGKGFSIVAGEVKKLAEMTKSSAEDIRTHILDFKDVTQQVLTSMEHSTSEVTESAALVTAISDNLRDVLQAAKHVQSRVSEVTITTEEMQQSMQEVHGALHESTVASTQVLAETQHVVAAVDVQETTVTSLQHTVNDLSSFVQNLDDMTSKYDLTTVKPAS